MNLLQKKKISKLLARSKASFAYLFGSRATGKGVVAGSDYDFAVFFGRGNARSRLALRLRLLSELSELLGPMKVDLIVLDDTRSTTLRFSVVNEGRLIYERDEAQRVDFEFRTLHEYEEFAPFLREYNEAYLRSAI